MVKMTLPNITYHNLTLAGEFSATPTLVVASLSGMLVSEMRIAISVKLDSINRVSRIAVVIKESRLSICATP